MDAMKILVVGWMVATRRMTIKHSGFSVRMKIVFRMFSVMTTTSSTDHSDEHVVVTFIGTNVVFSALAIC